MAKLMPAGGGFVLLPCAPGVCPFCAVDHEPDAAHNAQSLYYQYRFHGLHGRWPTWADAIAHCADAVQSLWRRALAEREAWTEPPAGVAPIAETAPAAEVAS